MELTPEIITMVVTSIVTAIFGELAKKFNWSTRDYLPFQNLAIGLFSGIIVYIAGLNENVLSAVILGIFASMTAGGLYDMKKMKSADNDIKEEEKKDE